MSDLQAEETIEEIDPETIVEDVVADEVELETTEEAVEEVEIVLDGEESPPSKRRPNGLDKRFKKLSGKIEEQRHKADDAVNRAAMLEEENKLLRLQMEQGKSSQPAKRPDSRDYETDEAYNAALTAYEDARIAEAVNQRLAETTQSQQTQASKADQEVKLMAKLETHYERADALKMANYEELEDKAIDIIGNDFAKAIMQNSSRSHLILGHLGVNTAKAQELADLLKTDPTVAYTQAIELGASLKTRSKNKPAPDPETKISSGSSVSNWQARIESAREKAVKTGDMSQLLALKKDAKDAGVTIR